jgi:hypothetical protein
MYKRECAVLKFHDNPIQNVSHHGNVEQMQNDRLISPEHVSPELAFKKIIIILIISIRMYYSFSQVVSSRASPSAIL